MLDEFEAKSEVVSHTITDVDVFTIVNDDSNKNAFINYIHVKMVPSTRALPTNINASWRKATKSF